MATDSQRTVDTCEKRAVLRAVDAKNNPGV